VLQQALTEYYETQDSVKLVSGKYTPTPTNNLGNAIVTEKVEKDKPPAPPIEEDPIIRVAGTSMRESDWNRIIAVQALAGTAPTLSPDQQLTKYLLSLFRDEESN